MVRMDPPASRTNNVVGESTVRIANTGCACRDFTVALAACASGHKLPAFVILKEPSGRITTKAFMSLRIPGVPGKGVGGRTTMMCGGNLCADQASYLQGSPADIFWNRPFKANLRRSWEMFMRKGERTPKGNLRKPSRQDALNFVSDAWAAVTVETVVRLFKGCRISNALDSSKDGELHDCLSDIGAVAPEHPEDLQNEGLDLVFGSDSEESFDGFESD
ncbi:hypothetical protein HPB52_005034 [Rhipicephalus sanguineus]|uniref:DDE-1 domain-containing protein n=1 Tax=Rhipicephalus sanguineus TaxID=34632 RepID=A0A9D4SVR2_RHISA|nr:hypothetical protein HPB52_005034 [Rhipicephalus sanguineus]